MTIKLQHTPDESSYSLKFGEEVRSVPVEGGASRCRRDQLGSTGVIQVTWTLDQNEFASFRQTYHALRAGSWPFLIDLLNEAGNLQEYVANFVPGSIRLQRTSGRTYTVGAKLEIKFSDPTVPYVAKLPIPPDKMSYSVLFGNEVLSVVHEGGAPRYRRTKVGAPYKIPVTWTVERAGLLTLMDFYKGTKNGSLPFDIDLLVEEETLTECKARFEPGTFELKSVQGHTFVLGADLEVLIPTVDEEAMAELQ